MWGPGRGDGSEDPALATKARWSKFKAQHRCESHWVWWPAYHPSTQEETGSSGTSQLAWLNKNSRFSEWHCLNRKSGVKSSNMLTVDLWRPHPHTRHLTYNHTFSHAHIPRTQATKRMIS